MDKKLFLKYLKDIQKKSDNTIEAYGRDVDAFERYLEDNYRQKSLLDVTNTDIISYVMSMKEERKSSSTISRKISALRSFYRFCTDSGKIDENPVNDIRMPRSEKKEIQYLTEDEIETLLELPDRSPKGIRDRAMLELMYATGIRVSELIELKSENINLKMGFVTCDGSHGKARIVPFGNHAKDALREYVKNGRDIFLKGQPGEDRPLFLNYTGEPLSRQGFWKILKAYGKEAGLEDRISPQIIRNSFAVHMIQNGADLKTLQDLMGHEDMQAMEVYLSLTRSRIKDVYSRTHPRA